MTIKGISASKTNMNRCPWSGSVSIVPAQHAERKELQYAPFSSRAHPGQISAVYADTAGSLCRPNDSAMVCILAEQLRLCDGKSDSKTFAAWRWDVFGGIADGTVGRALDIGLAGMVEKDRSWWVYN